MYTLHKHPEKGQLKAAETIPELQKFAGLIGMDTFYILLNGSIIYSQRPGFDLPIFLRNQGE